MIDNNELRTTAQKGIAIAPILFVIAILAILATAIAAGSSGFVSGASTETSRAMAEVVLSQCRDYQNSVARMAALGCDYSKLDLTPNNSWPTGSGSWQHGGDYTGGNGKNKSGNGSCALFDIRGGGLNWKKLPDNALVNDPTGAYGDANWDSFAGYPFFDGSACLYGHGQCQPATNNAMPALILTFFYLSRPTCEQINKLLGTNLDPDATSVTFASYHAPYSTGESWLGSIHGGATANNYLTLGKQLTEGCTKDFYATPNTASYIYFCALYIP